MNSRERVIAAINHKTPDRVPVDFGATGQTGINASTLFKLRKYLGLEEKPIKIIEPFQMLGEIDDELLKWSGADVIGLWGTHNMFGVRNDTSRAWKMYDGTPVLMPNDLEMSFDKEGSLLVYPQGDRNASPSAHMPVDGSFFDNIDRSGDFDEDNLTPIEDYKDSFGLISDESAKYYEEKAKMLFDETEYAIIGNLGGAGLGDAAVLPGPSLKKPKGIRRIDDWMMAHILYPDYIKEVFYLQTEAMLKNLQIYKEAVGEKIQIIWISGTDFGTQNGPFIGVDTFRDLYKPFYKKINDWVHQNTNWKTFYHSCGAISEFLDDFAQMGLDIINPVQLSANGMNAKDLKKKYGDKLVFWGGGVNTQSTLQNGSSEEIQSEVLERLQILSAGGGYVFNTIHNIVANVPPENISAMFEAVKKYNG